MDGWRGDGWMDGWMDSFLTGFAGLPSNYIWLTRNGGSDSPKVAIYRCVKISLFVVQVDLNTYK